MLKFTREIEAEVVTRILSEDRSETTTEIFSPKTPYDGEIINEINGFVDIQFGDGSCIFGLPKDCVVVES
jgi:hypothetical protein